MKNQNTMSTSSYADLLKAEFKFDDTYYETWSLGGTYGTCWDEDGPSEISAQEPLDELNYEDYELVIKKLWGSIPDEIFQKKLDQYKEVLDYTEDSESDYYGGCEENSTISFNTTELINMYLLDKFKLHYPTTQQMKLKFPEYFL